MKIIFMGTPEFAVLPLKALLSSEHEVVAVFSAPPKPQNRGLEVIKSPIHKLAEAHNIDVYTPSSLKDLDIHNTINSIVADIIIVVAYGFIIPQAILEAKIHGCLNIHPSLLPKYRGAAPLQRTIINDDKISAVCIMQMDKGLDTGDIILQENFEVPARITLESLSNICSEIGAKLLLKTLAKISSLPRISQDKNDDNLVYASKLNKEEGKINWHNSARVIDCQVRGMNPWPGAYFQYQDKIYKIIEAEDQELLHDLEPGTIIDQKLLIACGKNSLQIIKIQQAGRKILSVTEFMRGSDLKVGSIVN